MQPLPEREQLDSTLPLHWPLGIIAADIALMIVVCVAWSYGSPFGLRHPALEGSLLVFDIPVMAGIAFALNPRVHWLTLLMLIVWTFGITGVKLFALSAIHGIEC